MIGDMATCNIKTLGIVEKANVVLEVEAHKVERASHLSYV
jgi:hypothetical protein